VLETGNQTAVAKSKTKAPGQTFEEPAYLKQLIDNETRVAVKLTSNELVEGVIEFYDANFIRLTRDNGAPNLFIFKHDIKYLYELD